MSSSIRFRPASFIALSVLFLITTILAYVAGVMSGRSYGSEDFSGRNIVSRELSDMPSPNNGKAPTAALTAEELEYARALRSDMAKPDQKTVQQNIQTNLKDDALSKPVKSSEISGTPAITSGPAPKQENGDTNPSVSTVYDYVFQVAALRNEESVDSLRQRLEGKGLRTRMQREGKIFFVLVMLRGSTERAQEVCQELESMRLGQPVVRSRKLVPTQ